MRLLDFKGERRGSLQQSYIIINGSPYLHFSSFVPTHSLNPRL